MWILLYSKQFYLECWHWKYGIEGLKRVMMPVLLKEKKKKNVKRNLVDLVEKNMR